MQDEVLINNHCIVLQYTDDLQTDFIRAATEAYRERCMAEAAQDTNDTLVNMVRDVACDNSCSGHGTCQNSKKTFCFFCNCPDSFIVYLPEIVPYSKQDVCIHF